MNRALLIIICDFLLLSLLSLASFDKPELDKSETQPKEAVPDYSGGDRDLVEMLTLSLEEERLSREQLLAALNDAQETVRTQEDLLSDSERLLADREQLLADREQRLQEFQQDLQRKEAEARALERQRADLQREFTATRQNMRTLEQQLNTTASEAQFSKERLQALQAELLARQQAAARMQRRMEDLEKVQQLTEAEKQQLATQLVQSETEKQLVGQQLDTIRGEVQVVREEKARIQEHASKLAEGVTLLAEKSGELSQEIRQNRPLAANTIFNEFVNNRVTSRFQGVRTGLLGRTVEWEKQTKSVLVTDGNQTFAVYHIQDTPMNLGESGTQWERLSGTVARQSEIYSITQLAFLSLDPRIVIVPVGSAQAKKLGSNVYPISTDPYKFSEAVLVGAGEDYYGEAKFEIDPATPRYVKMERRLFSRFTGKFSPSSGDLVFSKTGDLLGIMVNNEYCALIDSFRAFQTIRTGPEISTQPTGRIVSEIRNWKDRLPSRLQ
jgi:hypothetical protein